MRLCQIEGCERKHNARGYCTTHETRLARGIPLDAPPRLAGVAFETRFVKSDGCWEWTGTRSASGYGRYGDNGYAHRIAYERYVGPIPDGHQVDHLCRNRACVNPDHLEAVTQKVNILRSMAPSAITVRTNQCHRGHELTPENTYRRPDGYRECLPCRRLRWRRWHARHLAALAAAAEAARFVERTHIPLHQEDQ